MKSLLTKNQTIIKTKFYTEHGEQVRLRVTMRYDDQCGNGHNSFGITADGHVKSKNGRWVDSFGGCCHDEIAKHCPEWSQFIKWHFMNADGPMYYVENTVYHARHNEPNRGWVYYEDKELGFKRQCMEYCDFDRWNEINEHHPERYTFEVDPKTAKVADYDAARSCAIWPDATDEELTADNLADRLPALIEAFKVDLDKLGLVY